MVLEKMPEPSQCCSCSWFLRTSNLSQLPSERGLRVLFFASQYDLVSPVQSPAIPVFCVSILWTPHNEDTECLLDTMKSHFYIDLYI